MTTRTALAYDAAVLSPTVTGATEGLALHAAAQVTNVFWEEMMPASVSDSFFDAADSVAPSANDAAAGFWS